MQGAPRAQISQFDTIKTTENGKNHEFLVDVATEFLYNRSKFPIKLLDSEIGGKITKLKGLFGPH